MIASLQNRSRDDLRTGENTHPVAVDPRVGEPEISAGSPGSMRPDVSRRRRVAIRALIAANLALGSWYIVFRWTGSISWSAWYIAVPLVLAETYSWVDAWLFGLTIWRRRERPAAPPPPDHATVDVFITVYDEPVELVRKTARAARDIHYPHQTYVLDDGASPEMQRMTEQEGVGYITRGLNWSDRPRHAKAGNLNNALMVTTGEFVLILDCDQVPQPTFLDHTLGWFRDPGVALVQTPQHFANVLTADPLGSQAPLFYGPIQQGKDGWNAAFFCGSNAILRREALMQLAVTDYVKHAEKTIRKVLRTATRMLRHARAAARHQQSTQSLEALNAVEAALREVREALSRGVTLQEATHEFRRAVDQISRDLVSHDLDTIQTDLEELAAGAVDTDVLTGAVVLDNAMLDQLSVRELSPLVAIASLRRLLADLDAVRAEEAQPVMPMATISVTEDMATAMRLHEAGWRSVYHHEILAEGLAPEDLGSMLQQRLRWAQGTIQVMLHENPLVQRGLSVGQRLMYLATGWSYLSGFTSVIYLAAPVLYLTLGVLPIRSLSGAFFWHLLPFLIVNQILVALVGRGIKTYRGAQYSLALFPLWIKAVLSTIRTELTGRELGFVVTPKTRQAGASLKLVRVQLCVMAILVLAVLIGILRLVTGLTDHAGAVALNIVWVGYDLVMLSVVLNAAAYRGFTTKETG